MSEVLIEEASPFGNIIAYAEDDGRTVYFYLYFRDVPEGSEDKIKACWVRNLVQSTKTVDRSAMLEGQAPLMPEQFCRNTSVKTAIDRSKLRIVWFEEADAAALLEGDGILAVIPGWAGMNGFYGYARDCIGEGLVAWELGDGNAMASRVELAQNFWKLWEIESFWPTWRDERVAAVEHALGAHSKYYAIDGGEFPPRAMLRFDSATTFTFVTIGVSLFSQPKVEQYFDDPSPYRCIELAFCLDRRFPRPLNSMSVLGARCRISVGF